MRIDLIGPETAKCGDMTAKSKSSALCKIARMIVSSGYDGIVSVYRGETKCFKDAHVSHWAGMTSTEGDGTSVRMIAYRPHPLVA